VASLFGALLPLSPLGHEIASETGARLEIPDGIIQIPLHKKEKLELMFYDAKSVGTFQTPKSTKKISQPEEDEFVRHCSLFRSEKMNAKLTAGIYVANDFSKKNMLNKSLQIRETRRAPEDVQIVYFPLKSLVKLYARLTKERQDFLLHFESESVYKLLGRHLTTSENKLIAKDADFETYQQLSSSNTNSVYVIESLVDVFFDHVYSLVSSENVYKPYVLDLSRRLSVTT
jgi:hypothetical protein